MKSECITNYLHSLYTDFADNRRIMEPRWERNKRAYDMEPDGQLDQRFGVGNKKNEKDKTNWRSESVCDLTRVKTNAGKILVCDVLLVGGKVPLTMKNMAESEACSPFHLSKENCPADKQPAQWNREPEDNSAVPAVASEENNVTKDSSSAVPMSSLISEQLVTANADIALQKAVMSAAIYGEGISRIYTDQDIRTSWRRIPEGWIEEKTVSEVLRIRPVSIWDFFTDLENHDIQKNLGCFERKMMSLSDVIREFSEDNGMNVKGSIEKLKNNISTNRDNTAASEKDNEAPWLRSISKRKKNLEVLEFWGRIPVRFIEDDSPKDDNDSDEVEIMAVMVENVLLRIQKVEPERRPYVRICWEQPSDTLSGRGIADACAPAQNSMDSIMRLIEDNKKITANASFATKRVYFSNKFEDNEFYPGKEIEVNASCDDVRKAIFPLQFPDVGQSGFDLLSVYKESGSESSMIPEIAHGISPGEPATAYEISVRNEKAGKYISDVVRGIDDNWIEPVGKFFYTWNMENPDVPDEYKGSFKVQALGFASYNDRVLRMNTLKEMMQVCLSNPEMAQNVDIKALLAEWMRTNDLDVEQFIVGGMKNQIPIQQSIQALAQQSQEMGQQLQQIIQSLPALGQISQLDAQKKQAEIQKINAEVGKIQAQTGVEAARETTNRAIAINKMRNDEIAQQQNFIPPVPEPTVTEPEPGV